MEKFCFDRPPSHSHKCQRGWSSGPVKTLNVRADFFAPYDPQGYTTTAIRPESLRQSCRVVNVLTSN